MSVSPEDILRAIKEVDKKFQKTFIYRRPTLALSDTTQIFFRIVNDIDTAMLEAKTRYPNAEIMHWQVDNTEQALNLCKYQLEQFKETYEFLPDLKGVSDDQPVYLLLCAFPTMALQKQED